MFIMKLAQEAGIPDGCINVFHGTVDRRLPFNILNPVIERNSAYVRQKNINNYCYYYSKFQGDVVVLWF